MRRLSVEEQALWACVANTVNKRHKRDDSPASLRLKTPLSAPKMSVQTPDTRPHPIIKKSKSYSTANTLDASWDRALTTGQIRPERSIDLHGHTLASAHARLNQGLADAIRDEIRVVLLVTGKAPREGTSRLDMPLRGIIRASIGDWLAQSFYRDRIAAIRNAHPRHGGSGALYIILRRPRG